MRVLIIEDEPLAAEKLANLIKKYDEKAEIVAEIDSVEGAVDWLRNNDSPDVIFQDIHLADGSAFEIYDQVQPDSSIIFTTAYDQYAIEAFHLKSVDYLLKPVKYEALESALKKYEKVFRGGDQEMKELIGLLKKQNKNFRDRYLVKAGNLIKSIDANDIAYFYSDQRVIILVTHEGKKFPVDQTLDEIENELDPSIFNRANRQFIVNIKAISEIHPYFKGRLKINLKPQQQGDIVISSEKSRGFKEWLGK
jgi:DNA-binding LytR/AlgR family response regulator